MQARNGLGRIYIEMVKLFQYKRQAVIFMLKLSAQREIAWSNSIYEFLGLLSHIIGEIVCFNKNV